MVLDNEDQRQRLIEVLNTVTISGNIQQVSMIMSNVGQLLLAVRTATIQTDIPPNQKSVKQPEG